jgi:hypothetical protein
MGLRPGKEFGLILERAYDAQLEGTFFDLAQALDWLRAQGDLPISEKTLKELGQDKGG